MTRIATMKHPNGTLTEQAFTHEDINLAQDAAVVWIAEKRRAGFEMVCIEFEHMNALRKRIAQADLRLSKSSR